MGALCPTLWYVVDHEARAVAGPFGKKRRMANAALGLPPQRGNSARSVLGALLGWPALTPLAALLLDAIVTAGRPLTRREAAAGAVAEAARLGHPCRVPPTPYGVQLAVDELRRLGLAGGGGRAGQRPATHQALPAAAETRGPVRREGVFRGADCATFLAQGYAVVSVRAWGKEAAES